MLHPADTVGHVTQKVYSNAMIIKNKYIVRSSIMTSQSEKMMPWTTIDTSLYRAIVTPEVCVNVHLHRAVSLQVDSRPHARCTWKWLWTKEMRLNYRIGMQDWLWEKRFGDGADETGGWLRIWRKNKTIFFNLKNIFSCSRKMSSSHFSVVKTKLCPKGNTFSCLRAS